MSYSRFASVYDALMNDAPYDEWEKLLRREAEPGALLDIGCGTGELAVRFATAGYAVTGVDLSDDMLAIAAAKADEAGVTIPFYEQDMAALHVPGLFDTAVIFCDSLNYLGSEQAVQDTFRAVWAQLRDGGVFLFDVHSTYKVNDVFQAQPFADADEAISFIWNSFSGEWPDSVEHELTFFVQTENGRYERFDELHQQRTFSPEQYTAWLEEAGFTVESVTADFTGEAPHDKSERLFFKARK